jgi:hypothetical protein
MCGKCASAASRTKSEAARRGTVTQNSLLHVTIKRAHYDEHLTLRCNACCCFFFILFCSMYAAFESKKLLQSPPFAPAATTPGSGGLNRAGRTRCRNEPATTALIAAVLGLRKVVQPPLTCCRRPLRRAREGGGARSVNRLLYGGSSLARE